MPDETITDLTRGVYRRQYSGFKRGRRINRLALEAEAWFWRVHASVDDFGNGDGAAALCHAATAGLRSGDVSVEQVERWLREMEIAELIYFYEVDGERFLHIVGFEILQPAPRNGRRVKRFPDNPPNQSVTLGNPDASRCSDYHSDYHSEIRLSTASAEPAIAATAAATIPSFLTFDTVAGRRDKDKTWELREDYVSELSVTFPGVDVRAECRKALAWTRAKPANRKTAGGMREFLYRWISRASDRGGTRSPGGVNGHRTSSEERNLDAVARASAELQSERKSR